MTTKENEKDIEFHNKKYAGEVGLKIKKILFNDGGKYIFLQNGEYAFLWMEMSV